MFRFRTCNPLHEVEMIYCGRLMLFVGAMIRNVGVKPSVFMTTSETGVTSVTASAATSAAAMKPYVVAAVVDPSEV